jgi:hypothetical protein
VGLRSGYRPYIPTQPTYLRAFWDFTDPSTLTVVANEITQVNDKSGNALHMIAPGGAEPGLSTLGGLPAASFDGTQWMSAGSTSSFNELHNTNSPVNPSAIYIIGEIGNSADPNALYAILGNDGVSVAGAGIDIRFDDRASVPVTNRSAVLISFISSIRAQVNVAGHTLTPNTQLLTQTFFNPSQATLANRLSQRVNDGAATTADAGPGGTTTTTNADFAMFVGQGGGGAFPLVGKINAILIFTHANVNTTFMDIERAALLAYYGI